MPPSLPEPSRPRVGGVIALSLDEVADVVAGKVEGTADGVVVTGPVVIDGREAGPGSLFVAFVGAHVDGHTHVPQAAERGAVAVLGTRATELPTVVVGDPQAALQRLAAYVVAQVRTDDLTVVALTGSQGKTSTKDLLAAVLDEAGPTVATHGLVQQRAGHAAHRAASRAGHALPGAGDGCRRARSPHRAHRPRRPRRVDRAQRRHGPPRRVRLPRRDSGGEERAGPRAAARRGRGPERRRRAGRRDGGAGPGADPDLRHRATRRTSGSRAWRSTASAGRASRSRPEGSARPWTSTSSARTRR